MSSKVLSNSLNSVNECTYKILDNLTVNIKITGNDLNIPPAVLFKMAARINKKRSFLFVSKVLGKHLPVNPITPILASSLLASKYVMEVLHNEDEQLMKKRDFFMQSVHSKRILYEVKPFQLSQKTIFIGFAETATALGHGVFENFQNAYFFHTTREKMDNKETMIQFEEEHSHATSHYCYIDPCHVQNQNPIVFIDDELTTGNTVLNIIHAIHGKFPRKSYTILTLLDWRAEESIQQFRQMEKKLGIEINVVSLIKGEIEVDSSNVMMNMEESNIHIKKTMGKIISVDLSDLMIRISPYYHHSSNTNYLWQTGRFGLDSSETEEINQCVGTIARKLVSLRSGGKTLCLGTGELMYLPMKIASLMGDQVYFQSTTRSPIYVSRNNDYLIQSKYTFPCPEDCSVQNYFYQIEPEMYQDVFVFFERELGESERAPLLQQLAALFPYVFVVTLSNGKGGVVRENGTY